MRFGASKRGAWESNRVTCQEQEHRTPIERDNIQAAAVIGRLPAPMNAACKTQQLSCGGFFV